MKYHFINLIIFLILFSSCKVSTDVVSKNIISKRKYLKGYHVQLNEKVRLKPNKNFEVPNDLPIKSIESIEAPTDLMASIENDVNLVDLKLNKKKLDEVQVETKQFEGQLLEKDLNKPKLIDKIKSISKTNDTIGDGSGDVAALLGLIFASLGLILSLFGIIGLLFLIPGLVLSAIGLKSEEYRTLALLGFIFSCVGFLIFFMLVLFLIALII